MIFPLLITWNYFFSWIPQQILAWIKPLHPTLLGGTFPDLVRSRAGLLAENTLLRQQLIILNRQVKRPQLTNRDRVRLVILSRLTHFWENALLIVQPDTVLRWHRELFRLYWQRKSKPKSRKPRISPEIAQLICQMAQENRLWGAERIRGELLKLGIKVCKRTIQKYMRRARKPTKTSQTWATFLHNQARHIWACDFTVVHDLFFRPLHLFVVMEIATRRIVHAAVTRGPSDAWTAQQLREATPHLHCTTPAQNRRCWERSAVQVWGKSPRYLIHDRDSKFGSRFSRVAIGSGIQELKTPYRAPKANTTCERFRHSPPAVWAASSRNAWTKPGSLGRSS
jgi:hypothetical protein